jgi:hypothetical protein
MLSSIRFVRIGLAFSFFLFLVGCGSGEGPKSKVSGTVTVDKVPLAEGTINFFTAKGNASGAIKDGKFEVSGVSPGKNRVQVVALGASGAAPQSMGEFNQSRKKLEEMARSGKHDKATVDKMKKEGGSGPSINDKTKGNNQEYPIAEGSQSLPPIELTTK